MIGRKQPPVAADDTDQPKGFDAFEVRLGDVMRGERATMGKSLLDVQRELKIKATYIAAIENADPTAFETPGFVAGYVRSYARYLGMDPEWAYDKFCEEGKFETVHGMSAGASGPKPSQSNPKIPGNSDPLSNPNAAFIPQSEAFLSRIEPGAIGSLLVLVGLIGALGYGGWSVLHEIQKVNLAPVEEAPGITAEVDPLIGATIVADTSAIESSQPDTDPLDRLYRPQALDVPVLEARDGPISTLTPDSIGVLADEENSRRAIAAATANTFPTTEIDEPVVKVVEDTAPEVVLFAVRPAWVRIRAADGTVLFEKVLDKGESYILPNSEEPPVLRAGNSGSVYFAVDGETYGPAAPGAQVAKNIVMAADSLREAYQLADLEQDNGLATVVAELRAQWQEEAE